MTNGHHNFKEAKNNNMGNCGSKSDPKQQQGPIKKTIIMSTPREMCCYQLQGMCKHPAAKCKYTHDDHGQPCQYGATCRLKHSARPPPLPKATPAAPTTPAPGDFLIRVIDALQERARSMLSGAAPAPPGPMITSSKFSAGLAGPAVSIPDQREDLLVADLQMKWNRPSKPTEPRPDMWRWAQVVSHQHPDIADASVAVDFANKFNELVKHFVECFPSDSLGGAASTIPWCYPKKAEDLISVVNEGLRADWSEHDIVQGILATALYT